MGRRRRVSVIVRFCKYELEELDDLVQEYGGFLPRSSLVNIALIEFLNTPKQDFQKCTKRKVNLALKVEVFEPLSQCAKTNRVHRTDLIRLAIRNLIRKYGTQEEIPKPDSAYD